MMKKNRPSKRPASTIGNIFQTILITLLVIGFIAFAFYVFYLHVNGKIHSPDNVLKVLTTAIAILIVRSYHIMIKARFNNDS
ncbi:MAG: hypothetical protein K0R26_1644 [Bacteroidota bacterium]|jgi:hypothetical protein|nr:hypothetical protein [Bacteroidota bacterium]